MVAPLFPNLTERGNIALSRLDARMKVPHEPYIDGLDTLFTAWLKMVTIAAIAGRTFSNDEANAVIDLIEFVLEEPHDEMDELRKAGLNRGQP